MRIRRREKRKAVFGNYCPLNTWGEEPFYSCRTLLMFRLVCLELRKKRIVFSQTKANSSISSSYLE